MPADHADEIRLKKQEAGPALRIDSEEEYVLAGDPGLLFFGRGEDEPVVVELDELPVELSVGRVFGAVDFLVAQNNLALCAYRGCHHLACFAGGAFAVLGPIGVGAPGDSGERGEHKECAPAGSEPSFSVLGHGGIVADEPVGLDEKSHAKARRRKRKKPQINADERGCVFRIR